MTTESNKAVVRRYIEEVINQGNIELIDTLFAPNMRDKVKGFLRSDVENPFPDGHEEIQHLVAEDNTVVAHWIFRGTHCAPFFGIPATGKTVEAHGFAIYFFQDGQIVDDLMVFENDDILEQLGATIRPPDSMM